MPGNTSGGSSSLGGGNANLNDDFHHLVLGGSHGNSNGICSMIVVGDSGSDHVDSRREQGTRGSHFSLILKLLVALNLAMISPLRSACM